MDLISVIVPVYKVEAYLDRCVRSIVEQTYPNLEIILVDDGSPDSSGAICDAWAEKDSRIKVIHKENGGVSAARNVGIQRSHGAYLCFTDSDDWLHPRFIELLYRACVEHGAQISGCRMNLCKSREAQFEDMPGESECVVHTTASAMSELTRNGAFKGGPCDKLYHRSVIDTLCFPVGVRHEDEYFVFHAIDRAQRLVFVDRELYGYYQHDESFMHTASLSHADLLEILIERLDLIRDKYPELYFQYRITICIGCVNHAIYALEFPGDQRRVYFKRIKKCRNRISFSLGEIKDMSLKKMIYVICSKACIGPFARVLALIRKERNA